jgi:hypothetical protein
MPPQDEKGKISSLISSLPMGKSSFNPSSLLGGGGGTKENDFLVILYSRTMMQRVIDHFNLIEVYEFSKKKKIFHRGCLQKIHGQING